MNVMKENKNLDTTRKKNGDKESDKKNKKIPNAGVRDHRIPRKSADQLSSAILEQHTKIFASMCPDEILDHYNDYNTRTYNTTLMLGDISGFTDLAEKYTKTGRGGPSKLTETLNTYIGAMVQEILHHHGDVLKFSGDAFIVMWKATEGVVMRDLAIEAMQTACGIQKHFGTYETDVGITLRVKLAIASGKTYFTSIGDPEIMSHYIITGKPVWDVKYAEGLCRGGDILVTPSSWQWANPSEYVHETLPDGIHTLILTCSSAWYAVRNNYYADDEVGNQDEALFHGTTSLELSVPSADITDGDSLLSNIVKNSLLSNYIKQVDYSLRPKIIKVSKAHLENSLRSYMVRPVIRSVEMNEPLEYLTEMRQVVIMFINVITSAVSRKQLIKLVDVAHKLVCRLVIGMHGCVNKTSLFDKDLMFLCVFGLRGDKHELESQIALRCACRVRNGLSALKNVVSVTIGVTTGVTYCGVVGHILRREYTVIGMTVNKAARLMCVYDNKVICDRESFLHSRMEARHFVLQETKYLKGITNIGPVYEFEEEVKYKVSNVIWNKYPLLGRDKEMKNFRRLLVNMVKYNHFDDATKRSKPKYNTLVIKSEPQMGKTRLLDEMTLNIPSGIPCNYISLVSSDFEVPYMLLHLVFSEPLKFATTSTSKERQDKLLLLLGKIRDAHYLCCLNQMFNVRFRMSLRYRSLSELQKQKIMRKLLLKLAKKCFDVLWVVIIDDAEYVDEESLQLFDVLTKINSIFFVLSIGRKMSAEYRLDRNLLKRAQMIELHGVDKWYHAGLACQVLNVNGLPPELEKFIQEQSFGNPGWMESYLVSLVQTGCLVILNVTRKEAKLMGYVLPHATMLNRITESVHQKKDTAHTDRWQMYKMSYMDSSISILGMGSKTNNDAKSDDTMIAVCKIPALLPVEAMDTNVTMDVTILKLFDSLTPLDQLLLKCASVLGELVNRKMLESLMETTSVKDIGAAVRKLFEIRVFMCGVGDFTRTTNAIMFYRNMDHRVHDTEVACYCTGIAVPAELSELPKYASCGLMRFKISMFRNTTYRLLTENQKMDLHSKALKLLQRYTRRCISCGEGPFSRLLGKTTVVKRKRRLDHLEYILDIPRIDDTKPDEVEEEEEEEEEELKSRARSISDFAEKSCLSMCKRTERKPTRTFSNFDFANCQCNIILVTVYTQILDHCRGIGKNEITLIAILEFVEVCLTGYNIPQARRLLIHAKNLLREMNEDKEIVVPYLTSKIESLNGRCYLENGTMIEATQALEQAMHSLGYNFPHLKISVKVKLIVQLIKLRISLMMPRKWRTNDGNNIDAQHYTDQLAYCLSQIFDVCRMKGLKSQARLAATWGLNAARSSNRDFCILCACYTNVMITAHIYQNQRIVDALENECLELCYRKRKALELQDLRAIAELYAGVFFSRWLRGEISKATRIGFVCIRMSQSIGSTVLKMIVLPRLVHLLMISCRHSEVVALLRQLEFVSKNDMDKSGRTWYYALCADVQLDTGLAVLSFRSCERYYLHEGLTMISLYDPEAEKRYFTSMWLWCIRIEDWEASKVWLSRNSMKKDLMDEHVVAVTITTLKKLEGLLILYVHKVNCKNPKAIPLMKDVRNLFAKTKRMLNIARIVIPRYTLLKAYYYMICFHKKTALKTLHRAKKVSLKMENKMIYAWADHCETAWTGNMSTIRRELWKQQSIVRSSIDWEEANANDSKLVPFTLPLPRYVL